ncbi:MAG: nuclear transport factor 2 family protein [Gammaproteobacteria bacterium]
MLAVAAPEDLSAITDTVHCYLRGMYEGDTDALRRAFHPKLQSFGYRDDTLQEGSGEDFVQLVESLEVPARIGEKFDMGIVNIDVTGSVAHVKVQDLHLGEVYTDYLALVKTGGRWLIVNKMYHKHD